jgi:hypothetical protein
LILKSPLKGVTLFNVPDEDIEKALEQIELIDSLLPKALPLYINHPWATEGVRQHYIIKLAEAGDLKERIERLTENPDTDPYLNIEI